MGSGKTYKEVVDDLRAAGGDAWDGVTDVDAELRAIREGITAHQDWQTRVQAWADESGLGPGSDPTPLWQELIEQTGELYESIAADDRERVARQIGRIEVVTCVLAGQMRIDPGHARAVALRELMWQRDNGRGPACRGEAGMFPREGS